MFRKLVSNLPYSPQLIEQVGYYAQRLKQEEFTRRMGVIFVLLGMMLQFFVFLAPPENSLATSANDIVYGGIANGLDGETPQETMLRIYNANFDTRNSDIKRVFNHFAINANDISNSTLVQISSQNKSLHSLGRVNKHAQDKPVRIQNSTYYLRPLYVWDVINDHNTYDALKIPDRNVWILLSCGNIVVEKPTPDLSIDKTARPQNGSEVKPGSTIKYRMELRNRGQVGVDGLVVEDVVLKNDQPTKSSALRVTEASNSDSHDVIPDGPVPGFYENIPHAYWIWNSYSAGEIRAVHANYVVPSNSKNGDTICNTAFIRSNGTQTKKSQRICHTVTVKEATPSPPSPEPTEKQPDLDIEKTSNKSSYEVGDVVTYSVTLRNSGDTTLRDITVTDPIPSGLDLQDDRSDYKALLKLLGVNENHTLTYKTKVLSSAPSTITNQVCADNDDVNKICDEVTITIEREEEKKESATEAILAPDISLSKGAKVITADENDPRRQDAHESTVRSNEVIEYRLLVSNSGDSNKEDFVVKEDLTDVLEYSELIENGGGELNENNILTWDPRTIKPNETIEHIFRVKVKDPIPTTPNSVSDPQSYDLIMDNTYGSTQIRIHVKSPTQKTVESVVKELPRTGVGMNMIITILFAGTVGYFYSRNRQLIQEIRLLRRKYNQGVQYES